MTPAGADPVPGVGDACAREALHAIGHIQSSGVLFALSEPELCIRYVSANVDALLGVRAEDLLGASFETVLGAAQFAAFRTVVRGAECDTATLRLSLGAGARALACTAHRSGAALVVECEPVTGAHAPEPIDVGRDIALPLARMQGAADIGALCETAAREVRRLCGFERAMIYRFDPEYNGEVVAESAASAAVSYLGLRFPASDIPPQARRLFLIHPVRSIADVESVAVPIVAQSGPLDARTLDLSQSFLRSASPTHLAYLRNMGVRSSLTASIVIGERLWGVIACHHSAPRPVAASTRAVCRVIAQLLASQLAARIDTVALRARLASRSRSRTTWPGSKRRRCSSPRSRFKAGGSWNSSMPTVW